MEVGLLGPLRVDAGHGNPVVIGGVRQRTLLALLALRPGVALRTDRLIDDLWGDRPPQLPANALQLVVFKLRRVLGADVISTTHPGYGLQVDPDDVDAHRFERFVREGRAALTAGRPDEAVDCFDRGLELWRDDALVEFGDVPAAASAAARWHELRATATEDRFEVRLGLGHHAQLVAELNDAIAAHPYRERLRAQLMLALHRSGRQSAALHVYGDARRTLAADLGLEPGAALRQLERQILDQDHALDLPASPPMTEVVKPHRSTGTAVRVRSNPLVGRQKELAALDADLLALAEGRGGLRLIGGHPGIGKTRLVEETVAAAGTAAVIVAWGRCHPGRGAPAFWPWIQIVRELREQLDPETIYEAAGARGGELTQLVPELDGILHHPPPPPPTDPSTAYFRLADALTLFLRALSRRRPVLIALDDLHWADAGSLDVLRFAASGLTDVAVRFLATYRTVDPTIEAPFSSLLADLSRNRGMRRIELAGLDGEALAELLSAAGLVVSAESVDDLQRRTLGNAFFVTEIVKLLADTAERGVSPPGQAVPASVRDVVRQRLDRLPSATVDLLSAAAILRQDVDPTLLALMTDNSASAVLDHLEPAIVAEILVPLTTTVGRYSFAHGIVAETIESDLGDATRARLNHRAAIALHTHHCDLPGPHLIPIADHWFRAIPVAAIDDAIDAALRASRWAAEHVAHRQAEEQLRAALDLIALIPDERRRAVRELELLDQLSGLLVVGAGYSAPGLREICDRMRELSHATEDRNLLLGAMWRLSIYYCTVVDIDAALDLGHDVLATGERDGDPLIVLTGHLALGVPNILHGELHTAKRHLDAALDMCRNGYDDALQDVMLETPGVWARSFSGWNTWLLGDAELAAMLGREAINIGERCGHDSYAATIAFCIASWVAAMDHDALLTRDLCADGIARAIAGGFEVQLFMKVVEGWAIGALGNHESGSSEILDTSEVLLMAGTAMLRPFHFAMLADLAIRRDAYEDALNYTDQGISVVEKTEERWSEPELRRLRGVALSRSRQPDLSAARQELAAAITIADRHHSHEFATRARQDLAELARRRPIGPERHGQP